jgi:two-component system response regulator MtrA
MKPHTRPLVLLLGGNHEERLHLTLQLELLGFAVDEKDSFLGVEKESTPSRYSLVLIDAEGSPVEAVHSCTVIKKTSSTPVIMLLQHHGTVSEELALDAGAHDFITKPVRPRVLALRLQLHCGNRNEDETATSKPLIWGQLSLNPAQRDFRVNTVPVALTHAEFEFMTLLMENPLRIFSRDQIIDAIGSYRGLGSDHIVDNHASRIRKKIKDNGGPDVISVVRSVGFRLSSQDNHETV